MDGQTALHVAARNGHVNLMKHLSQRTDANHRQIKDKNDNVYFELLPTEKKLSFLLDEMSEVAEEGMLTKVSEDNHRLWFMIVKEGRPEGSYDVI